jgi:hypothetical protein
MEIGISNHLNDGDEENGDLTITSFWKSADKRVIFSSNAKYLRRHISVNSKRDVTQTLKQMTVRVEMAKFFLRDQKSSMNFKEKHRKYLAKAIFVLAISPLNREQ